jgi:hypothetical protein
MDNKNFWKSVGGARLIFWLHKKNRFSDHLGDYQLSKKDPVSQNYLQQTNYRPMS